MPAPYSYDLRSKAIEAVKRGEKKTQVSRLFKIRGKSSNRTENHDKAEMLTIN